MVFFLGLAFKSKCTVGGKDLDAPGYRLKVPCFGAKATKKIPCSAIRDFHLSHLTRLRILGIMSPLGPFSGIFPVFFPVCRECGVRDSSLMPACTTIMSSLFLRL